jgi:hypothetical protein
MLLLQYKLVYGLFVVPIVTGFFSVLGMAIERFQVGNHQTTTTYFFQNDIDRLHVAEKIWSRCKIYKKVQDCSFSHPFR